MHNEETVKRLKTKDLLKLFFEKSQRSFVPKERDVASTKLDLSLSQDEEIEMYVMYNELQLRAGEYDKMKE